MARVYYNAGELIEARVRRNRLNKTALAYVASRLGLPANRVKLLLEMGAVALDGRQLAADETVDFPAGSLLRVRVPANWPPYLVPRAMPLDILYEDAHLCALNKPAGVVVHPSRGHMDGKTLQNALLHRYQAHGPRGLAPAHRLDYNTSGVVIFTRNRAAFAGLSRQFAAGTVKKTYLAVAAATTAFKRQTVDAPIGDDPADRHRSIIISPEKGGKEAVTKFKTLQRGAAWALLAAYPLTGRTHQIRAHAKHIGLPLFGDRDYHPDWQSHRIKRQALHAAQLSFSHPATAAALTFSAPLPADLRELLRYLRRTDSSA